MGQDAIDRLANCRVAVFGLGGVGGHVVEALVRGGVGAIDLIDHDTVSITNLNRQLFATHQTLGMPKTEAAKERILSINPDVKVTLWPVFFNADTALQFDFSSYDYVIDAIDTVSAKVQLVLEAKKANVPIISAMGAGNKMNATAFCISDLAKTSVCPLAKAMRARLRPHGIAHLKVVYSKELPMKPMALTDVADASTAEIGGNGLPASNSYAPPVMGLLLAGEVIQDITGVRGNGLGG